MVRLVRFNAGSALSAGSLAANAFIVTNTSAAAGALTWMAIIIGGAPGSYAILQCTSRTTAWREGICLKSRITYAK